jgi:sirohydrochlorin ferrochelatase
LVPDAWHIARTIPAALHEMAEAVQSAESA